MEKEELKKDEKIQSKTENETQDNQEVNSEKKKDESENSIKEEKQLSPEEEITNLKDKLTRTLAEMENQRRRFEKEKDDAFEYGGFTFAREALNLLEQQTYIQRNGDQYEFLTDEEKDQVENAVKSLEEAIKSENVESIETSTKELNDVLTPLTQKLYTPEEGATASDPEGDASSDNAGDNTVDAEFEEVKEEDK